MLILLLIFVLTTALPPGIAYLCPRRPPSRLRSITRWHCIFHHHHAFDETFLASSIFFQGQACHLILRFLNQILMTKLLQTIYCLLHTV